VAADTDTEVPKLPALEVNFIEEAKVGTPSSVEAD
jgi:hypothetical protein